MRPPTRIAAVQLAVISGASRGLGLALSRELLCRAPEATVVATSRSIKASTPTIVALQQEFGPSRVVPMACDLMDAEAPLEIAQRVKADLGRPVDLLLNVAGVLHDAAGSGYMPERSLRSVEAEELARVMAVNAIGPVQLTRALAPQLARGAIIGNLSARVGSISDNRLGGWWSYRMSKAALNMATVNMAHELGRRDIYAVALHPGTTATDLSAPFQNNVKPEKLFTPEYSAGCLLDVLDGLEPEGNGGFYAFDGSRIEF
jgi:NAD(P)-dependent dehydrogenase (short-subunit alcohol dehydrogenase family)